MASPSLQRCPASFGAAIKLMNEQVRWRDNHGPSLPAVLIAYEKLT